MLPRTKDNGMLYLFRRTPIANTLSKENPMDKKYLFFDIDGTLVAGGYEHTYVPESAMTALRKLREAGHVLCIATGRSHGMAVAYMDAFGIRNMVSDGGNGITVDGELVDIEPLPQELVEALTAECDEKGFPWARFHDDYLFVEPTDKARGIKRMMDHFGAPYEDVIVFGDATNDLSMFIDDWTCVAMGNACPELKGKADYITTNVDDNGIYNACKALGLFVV